MAILLVPIALLLIFLDLMGSKRRSEKPQLPWEGNFLLAALILGVLVVLISEGLSLFRAIDQTWLALCWLGVVLTAAYLGWKRGTLALGWGRLRVLVTEQDNHSGSVQGVLRGLYYQIKQPQGKLVRVVCGEVLDVASSRYTSCAYSQWR